MRVALIGGMAVNTWEEPRTTLDMDLVVAADARGILELVRLLKLEGFTMRRGQALDEASGPDFVQMENQATNDRIDLQTSKTPFQDSILQRAAAAARDGTLPIASVEDLLVLKLIASRRKDMDDLERLAARENVDWTYVGHWADVWGVSDRLERLRRSSSASENPA